jgi:hypothetical protein
MSRTILAATVIASTIAGVVSLFPSATLAADAHADTAPPFQVNCWIGMKFGDQPGQLIRGWICERQDRPAAAAAPNPQPPLAKQQDVAAFDAGSHHR